MVQFAWQPELPASDWEAAALRRPSGRGRVDQVARRYAMEVRIDDRTFLEIVRDHGVVYTRSPGSAWTKRERNSGGGAIDGFDPLELLTRFPRDEELVAIGRGTVRGEDASHFRVSSDSTRDVDIWLDDDGRLVRVHVGPATTSPIEESSASGGRFFSETTWAGFTVDFWGYGTTDPIDPPSGPRDG